MVPEREKLMDWWRLIYRIRSFEDEIGRLAAVKELPGYVHLCTGQEAVAVGAIQALNDDEWMTSTYRNHGHAIARGLTLNEIAAELWGRVDGVCAGRGGSMHVADQNRGMIGAFGVIAAGLPIAAGAAWAARYLGQRRAALGFFGDGAVNHGWWHETMGFASLFNVGVVYVCESNVYAEATATDYHLVAESIPAMVRSYGITADSVDGMDVVAVNQSVASALDRARDGGGPTVIECKTYRFAGQFEGDKATYRPKEEAEHWALRDPLKIFRTETAPLHNITADELDAIAIEEDVAVAFAIERARGLPWPDPATIELGVFTDDKETIPWLAN